ncbi:MAG: 2-amino-4-hydroxy-6-hydroxymethyldihydropteridine diphosphokinase [Muribaculaceae bacterium]
MRYYLNIGANLGDRSGNIARAVAEIEARLCGDEVVQSAPFESEPWGFESEHRFLNVGLALNSAMPPQEALREVHAIEEAMGSASHRNADGTYADRIVDIDVIAIDEQVIATAMLTVPHPRMAQREFVLVPMAEIAPEWRHPVVGLTARDMLAALRGGAE